MLNVNQITATLAKLPDASLQQYAQMHKNDPYMLSLAVAESNRRKQMRESAQTKAAVSQGRPETVVDQQIAQIAQMPEQMGIGQLPAGNMDFAGGGIVAFADGGETEARNPYAFLNPGDWMSRIGGVFEHGIDAEATKRRRRAEEERRMAELMEPNRPRPSLDEAAYGAPPPAQSPAATQPAPATPPMAAVPPAGLGRLSASMSSRGSAGTGTGAGPIDVNKALAAAELRLNQQEDPAGKLYETLGQQKKEMAEAGVSGLEAINKKYDDVYKGRRERLDKREGELGKMRDEGLGMALLQAGAAMMTTPGKLGVAIGRGVDVGSKQYATGIERLRTAQEKLSDARDRLEEAESARGETSAREMLKARQGVRAAGIETSEAMIKHTMDTQKVNRQTAIEMVKAQVQMAEGAMDRDVRLQSERIRAGAQRDTPDMQFWQALVAKHGGDAIKAQEEYQRTKGEKFNPYGAYQDYVKAFAGKETLSPPMSFPQYVAQFAIPTTTAPPKGATTLRQP